MDDNHNRRLINGQKWNEQMRRRIRKKRRETRKSLALRVVDLPRSGLLLRRYENVLGGRRTLGEQLFFRSLWDLVLKAPTNRREVHVLHEGLAAATHDGEAALLAASIFVRHNSRDERGAIGTVKRDADGAGYGFHRESVGARWECPALPATLHGEA